MTEYKPRDKKIQGYTTSKVLHAINDIERAEGKKMSAVVHDALTAYTSDHPNVQLSTKREINISKLSMKMASLSENASKANEYDEFESNFIHFCVNLSHIKANSPQEFSLIGDLTLLLSEIETHHEDEYGKCIKIARKLMPKRILKQVFQKEFNSQHETLINAVEKEHDRKKLSRGQYNKKYNE